MASRACGNKDEPLLVDTINKEPIGFDMAFAMSSIRSAQGMVARCLGKAFPSLERLEDHLEFCEIFEALRGLVWVDASANRVATVYTNAPKTAPRAHFCRSVYTPAYPRLLARPGGATGPTTSTAPWPRDARALGPEAHATGAVTPPPTHTGSRSLSEKAHFTKKCTLAADLGVC